MISTDKKCLCLSKIRNQEKRSQWFQVNRILKIHCAHFISTGQNCVILSNVYRSRYSSCLTCNAFVALDFQFLSIIAFFSSCYFIVLLFIVLLYQYELLPVYSSFILPIFSRVYTLIIYKIYALTKLIVCKKQRNLFIFFIIN